MCEVNGNLIPAEPAARPAATIYDIADLAGVNPSTVSRALTKPGRISARTEKKIRDAAAQLNYRVNPMARALPTGRTRTLGLLVADLTNPMFFDVMRGAEQSASRSGYTLVLAESQESGERELQAAGRVAPSVDGLVLVTTRMADDEIRRIAGGKPLVVVNRRVESIPAVVPDLQSGVGEALEHLHGAGHRSVAYLSGPARSWMSRARWELILDGAVALGMNVVEIGPNAPTLDGGRAALTRVRAAGVTAVLAYNDLVAIGLMQQAQEGGLDVPGAMSIVGFDDIFGSDFTSPKLTTISIPYERIGELAIGEVLALIGDAPGVTAGPGAAEGTSGVAAADLATRLTVRGSTGPARGT
ncbi:LacI family DNA-binding transcriptional regulator [Tomitella gaofuii]|uniref:LacI family DNA-binding transcriptional regulator n=1 Tax=Tomitella gaofuii TaxID=2760083 RepID=UPI0015F9DA84|nr:LacI family DNA-binding transcriptional regulator [Tomitella gaofuii]